jgi:hypothetical protein
MGAGYRFGPGFSAEAPQVLYLDEPLKVGGVADLEGLTVVDAVYEEIRGAKFGTQ